MLLFVDNDALSARHWVAILRDSGYIVEFRNSVERALDAATSFGSELQGAIIDITMPAPGDWINVQGGASTGLELARRLRALNPYLPIIFMTGQGNAAIFSDAGEFEGPSATFSKRYVRPETLLAKTQELVGSPASVPV